MGRKPGHRRRTSVKRIVGSLLLLLVVAIGGAGGVAIWGMQAVQAPGPLDEATNVIVERGMPTTDIGVLLEDEGVVSDHRLFVIASYLTRASRGDLKAGEYEFPAGASIAQVMAILRSGRSVVHKVTIPEGWTIAQVVERVNAHPALSGTITETPPEGSVLPDTYIFQRGLSRDELIARMQKAQDALLDELWEKRAPDLPLESREEAIILASIVEKETGVAEERQQVAAVFVNRLHRDMRLQSDPTIIYGITGGEPLDRPIRRSDILEETPYNTYRIDGLPPTPIANPGREAIAAVLQPGDAEHLYFVADGSGGHAFAETLTEHNKNVQRWREIEQQKAASEPAPEELEEEGSEPAAEAAITEIGAVAAEASATQPVQDEVVQEADETAQDAVDIAAAVAVSEDPAASDEPAEASAETAADSPDTPTAATPRPEPRPDSPVTLTRTEIPIPRPKPAR